MEVKILKTLKDLKVPKYTNQVVKILCTRHNLTALEARIIVWRLVNEGKLHFNKKRQIYVEGNDSGDIQQKHKK